jgi:hypothetical protein
VSARGINRNQPHSHRGKLHPYTPGPFHNLQLSNADENKLAQGEAVMKQTMPTSDDKEESGSAICVQDIHAPYEAVWYQILDLDHYTDKISKLKECKNYYVQKNAHDGTYRIKTKQVLGVLPGYAVRILLCVHIHGDIFQQCMQTGWITLTSFTLCCLVRILL